MSYRKFRNFENAATKTVTDRLYSGPRRGNLEGAAADDDVEADDLLERALSLQLSRRLEELRAEHDYLNERMKEGG